MTIQSSNNIVKFIENVMISVKAKYVTLIFRRENRVMNNIIMFQKHKSSYMTPKEQVKKEKNR